MKCRCKQIEELADKLYFVEDLDQDDFRQALEQVYEWGKEDEFILIPEHHKMLDDGTIVKVPSEINPSHCDCGPMYSKDNHGTITMDDNTSNNKE